MSQHDKPTIQEDEINLYDYWKTIAKRKRLIIGLFLASIILAGTISFIMAKIYRGEAVLKLPTKELPAKELITAKELTAIIGEIDKEKIRSILPKTHHLAANIKLNEIRGSTDKMQVFIDSKNPGSIPDVLSELIVYLNNNPLIKRHVEQEKERLLKQRDELSKTIKSSKELLKAYQSLLLRGDLIPVGFNPIELNVRVSNLKIEKITVEQAINNLKGVEIIGQHISKEPVSPRVKMNIALAGVISLFAGIFLAFFMEFIQKARGQQLKDD
jgi:LPS O-antigen subunit length determinant protein (WzzB/FepE family)